MEILKDIIADLTEGKNEHGERTFNTYHGWKRAVKKRDPNAKIEGDKDIANASGHGEWDGEKGVIYKDKASESVEGNEEPITEVSKKTLASYIKKSAKDVEGQAERVHSGGYGDADESEVKLKKRQKGIEKAADKLAKESLNPLKQLLERPLTDEESSKKEEIVKSMKKKKAKFAAKYGDRAEQVMYATATKLAKNEGLDDPELVEFLTEHFLTEERGVYTFGLIRELKNLPSFGKFVDIHSTADGTTALVRTKDGNAYEVTVKQSGWGNEFPDKTKPDQYKERRLKRAERIRKSWEDR